MPLVVILAFAFCWVGVQFADNFLLRYDVWAAYSKIRISGQLHLTSFMLTFHTERFNRALTKFGHKVRLVER